MKELYWPEFETALRRRVCAQIAQSPHLVSEYQRRKWTGYLQIAREWFFPAVWFLFLWKAVELLLAEAAKSATSQFPFWPLIALAATGISFFWARFFRKRLQESPVHLVYCGLPTPESAVFHLIWRETLPFQFWLCFGFGIPVFGALYLPIETDFSAHNFTGGFMKTLVGLGGSALFFLATRALALWIAYRWSILCSAPLLFAGCTWVILIFGIQAAFHLLHLTLPPHNLVELFTLIFPAGWVGYAFHHGILTSDIPYLLTLIPMCLFIGHKFQQIKYLRTTFSIENQNWFLPFNLSDSLKPTFSFEGLALTQTDSDLELAPPDQPDAELMAVQVRQTLFNPGFDLAKEGWVERLSARCLTRSEQHLLEFMFGSSKKSNWTKLWWTGFASATVVWISLLSAPKLLDFWEFLVGYAQQVKYAFLFDILVFAAGLVGLAVALYPVAVIFMFCFSTTLADCFEGFRLYRTSEKAIPIYAVYPTGFWLILRLQWKLSLIRLVLSFPALVFLSIGINSVFKLSPGIGIELAVKIACILLIALFVGMMDGFSRTTTSRFISLFKLINVGGVLLMISGFFSLGFLAINRPTWEFATAWLVFIGLMFLWLMVFGKLYNHGKVDLLRKAA